MGCGGSTADDLQSLKEFLVELMYIGIPKWDDFFWEAAKVGGYVGALKGGMVDRMHKIYYYMDLYKLKGYNPCEAFRLFLWTLSAQTGGDFKSLMKAKPSDVSIKLNPDAKNDPIKLLSNPEEALVITVKGFDFDKEMTFVLLQLALWVGCVITSTFKLPQFIKDFSAMIEKGNAMKETARQDFEEWFPWFSTFQKAKCIANTVRGVAGLISMASNMSKLLAECPRYVKGAMDLMNEYEKIIETADEKGKEALAKGIRTFHDILDQIHPGTKLTNAEANKEVASLGKKRKRGSPDVNAIDIDYRQIGITKFDDYFAKVTEKASKVTNLFNLAKVTRDAVYYIEDLYVFTDPNMKDAFKAYAYLLSTLKPDLLDKIKIQDIEIQIQDQTVQRKQLKFDFDEEDKKVLFDPTYALMMEYLEDWFDGIQNKAATFKDDFKAFDELFKQAEQLQKDQPNDLKAAKNKAEAEQVLLAGFTSLNASFKNLESLNKDIDRMIKDVADLPNELQKICEDAKGIPEKAKEDGGIKEIYHLAFKYLQGEKKKEEDLKKLEKEGKLKRRNRKKLPEPMKKK